MHRPTAYLHTTAGFVFDAYANGVVPEFVVKWFHGEVASFNIAVFWQAGRATRD